MIRVLIGSCRDATALMEKRFREKLSFPERVKLVLHKTVCVACRRYEQQSALMEHIFKAKNKGPITLELDAGVKALEKKILNHLSRKDK